MPRTRKQAQDGLTEFQEMFCQQFLLDGNAGRAYQRAGGSSGSANANTLYTEGSKLLRNPKIQARLGFLRFELSQAVQMDCAAVLSELAYRSNVDPLDFVDLDENGAATFKRLDDIPASSRRCIQKFKLDAAGRISEVQFSDRARPLELLMKSLGLLGSFPEAVAVLKQYGLHIVQNPESSTGWEILSESEANQTIFDRELGRISQVSEQIATHVAERQKLSPAHTP